MPKPESSPSAIFLDHVRQQLNGLEPAGQREILAELTTHLHDAVAENVAASSATAVAEAAAVQAMGDPAAIGRRLRDEHLNRRLSFPAAILCALPLAAIALLFRQSDLYYTMRNFASPNSGFPFSFLLALTPVIALSLVLLARTRQSWPATLLGGSGLLFLLGVAHGIRGAQYAPLAFIGLGILLLATISLTLGVALRWGYGRAALALLGSVGVYGCYAWLHDAGSISTLALGLGPILGAIALGLTPRRYQTLATWAIFAMNWALIISYSVHVAREMPVPGPTLGTFDFISPAFLIASAAMLVAVQITTKWQASGRLTLPERWAR
jgi:HAAS domain-containing protein